MTAATRDVVERAPRGRDPELARLTSELTSRLAERMVDAFDRSASDTAGRSAGDGGAVAVDRRQQVLVGGWLDEELTRVDHDRLRRGLTPLDPDQRHSLRAAVVADLVGAGPLEQYLQDPTVEEIDVNSHRRTWVSYADGRKVDVGQLWASASELVSYQKRLARRTGVVGAGRLDTASPMLTFQTDDGARVVMVLGGPTEHGVSTEPRIAVRRYVVRRVGLAGLAAGGMFPHELVAPLQALVRCGFTMLVSGSPGAGKTTLLVELLGEVPPDERVVTVEKHLLELRLEDDPRHPDALSLVTRHANTEGAGEVTTRQLVELSRRLNPDRVVVGELVEDEALDMLDVASMCARGSLATIHAHTADVVLDRLAYYVAKSSSALPEHAVWNLIANTVDFVIHVDLVRNAVPGARPVRRVTSVLEVAGRGESGGVATSEIWGLDDADRLVRRGALSARHRRRLLRAGVDPSTFSWEGT